MTRHSRRRSGRAGATSAVSGRGRRASERGFTLIEVIIAASLLGVLGIAIAETFRAARDADRRLQTRAERRAQDRAALQRITRDLEHLIPPGGTYAAGLVGESFERGAGGDVLSSPTEEAAADALANERRASPPPYASRDRVTLAVLPGARRFGSIVKPGAGAMESVVWEIDEDATTPERGLVRRATTVRDPIAGAPAEPTEEVGPSICGLSLRYFDGTDWQETWDSSASDTIPQAIEVALAVRDAEGIHRVVTVVAPAAGRPAVLKEGTE